MVSRYGLGFDRAKPGAAIDGVCDEAPMTFRRIAVEEAFVTPEIVDEWRRVLGGPDAEIGFRRMGDSILAETPANASLHRRLLDLGTGRIAHMDAVGIDMQILSLTAPGVQTLPSAKAVELASASNDQLAAAILAYPTRFAGLGAIFPLECAAAAAEIHRIKGLGLHGVIVNSHTADEYLDLPKFAPIWEALAACGLPLYLHPREPSPSMIKPYLDYGLYFAGWGFAAETGLHAMRIIMSGLLDSFPDLRIVLGHLGEGIPFWLDRIDNRYLLQVRIGAVKELPRLPSAYFREHFVVTTAGMTSLPPLHLCLEMLGKDRILFAGDYPYEDDVEGVTFLDHAPISDTVRQAIYQDNACRVFGLAA